MGRRKRISRGRQFGVGLADAQPHSVGDSLVRHPRPPSVGVRRMRCRCTSPAGCDPSRMPWQTRPHRPALLLVWAECTRCSGTLYLLARLPKLSILQRLRMLQVSPPAPTRPAGLRYPSRTAGRSSHTAKPGWSVVVLPHGRLRCRREHAGYTIKTAKTTSAAAVMITVHFRRRTTLRNWLRSIS